MAKRDPEITLTKTHEIFIKQKGQVTDFFFFFFTTIRDQMCWESFLYVFVISVSAVGEASDDRQREEEDHVLCHFSRHRHHMCRLVALRPH